MGDEIEREAFAPDVQGKRLFGREGKERSKRQYKMRLALWIALVALTWVVCCSFYCEGHSKKSTNGAERLLDDPRLSPETRDKMRQKVLLKTPGREESAQKMRSKAESHSKRINSQRTMHGEKPQKRNWQDIPRPDAVRNLDAPIKFDSTTFSLRLPFVGEEAITKHMWTFIQSYRMDDTADVYTDLWPVLTEMAMNLSVAAADMYNGFDDITWIGDFEESIICDLDLSTLLVSSPCSTRPTTACRRSPTRRSPVTAKRSCSSPCSVIMRALCRTMSSRSSLALVRSRISLSTPEILTTTTTAGSGS